MRRAAAVLGAAAALALGSVVVPAAAPAPVAQATVPSASALSWYYVSEVRCKIGTHPVLSYLKWYRYYDYNSAEEAFGKRDYRVFSHNDPYRYNVKYVLSFCNSWGYIVH